MTDVTVSKVNVFALANNYPQISKASVYVITKTPGGGPGPSARRIAASVVDG